MKSVLIILIIFCSGLEPYEGKILRVIDGDTYVLQTAEEALKIRMDGIDAPESDQEFGAEAKEFLNKYLYKAAKVIPNGVDRYGRTIGTLFVDGVNINLLMVRDGFSWHYKKYSSDQELARAEEMARKEKKGLWKNEGAISPWEWRKQKTIR